MKIGAFILFFSIVLTFYTLANFYIFHRVLQAFPAGSNGRIWFMVIFWFLVSSFVISRVLERVYPSDLTEVITWVGSIWLAIMVYALLSVVIVDIARIINHFFHIFPSWFYSDYPHTKRVALLIISGLIFVVTIVGFINARLPRVHKFSIHINKHVEGLQSMRLVMASDIHMGTLIGKNRTTYLVNTINSLRPDLILFAGDVVDEDLAPVIRRNLGSTLTQLRSTFGVYAITGNHEYIGGVEPAVKYLTEHGIHLLRDTSILVDGKFFLVGRDDRDKPRFTGKERKSLEEVMTSVDRSFPVILMDHQPFHLQKTVEQGVDLQLSGHTHHGQLWPFNYITKAIYELSWGYKKIGNSHFYVSSGFGSWGPPIRLGNRPEIVEITIQFN